MIRTNAERGTKASGVRTEKTQAVTVVDSFVTQELLQDLLDETMKDDTLHMRTLVCERYVGQALTVT
jgi:hypothetical protein